MPESLFGHLVNRFSSSPENLATEALNFILNRSHIARDAFTNLLSHLNVAVPVNLKFSTQEGSDQDPSIPDLEAKDSDGNIVLVCEAKFWAGLTDNQPITYLERLIHNNGKALIFIAPAKRFSTLWPELLRRCQNSHYQTHQVESNISEIKTTIINKEQSMLLISWRVILNSIHQSLEAEGERDMLSNLTQLNGLCEYMDETAFLPLRSEELTANIGTRLLQYCQLVDEITNILVSKGLASTKDLRASPRRGAYIRYMIISNNACSFEFNPILWNKYFLTPLWFGIRSHDWKFDPEARRKLVKLEICEPSRLICEESILYIPIYLEIGVEKNDVIKGIMEQLQEIFSLLKSE